MAAALGDRLGDRIRSIGVRLKKELGQERIGDRSCFDVLDPGQIEEVVFEARRDEACDNGHRPPKRESDEILVPARLTKDRRLESNDHES